MVVRKDDRSGVRPQCSLYDLARIDAGLRQRALEHFIDHYNAVLCIEKEGHEDLMFPFRQEQPEVVADRVWGG